MNTHSGKSTVNCPSCKQAIEWSSANRYRPFCSARCQILDLGEWASGNRYIPSDASHDDVTANDLNKE